MVASWIDDEFWWQQDHLIMIIDHGGHRVSIGGRQSKTEGKQEESCAYRQMRIHFTPFRSMFQARSTQSVSNYVKSFSNGNSYENVFWQKQPWHREKKGANLFILCSNFRTGKSATFGSFMRSRSMAKEASMCNSVTQLIFRSPFPPSGM